MTVDFGQIKNSGSEHSLLTIYFSVTLTRNLPRKSESKHLVAVGAEYSKGSVVWVAQSQITTTPLTQVTNPLQFANVLLFYSIYSLMILSIRILNSA